MPHPVFRQGLPGLISKPHFTSDYVVSHSKQFVLELKIFDKQKNKKLVATYDGCRQKNQDPYALKPPACVVLLMRITFFVRRRCRYYMHCNSRTENAMSWAAYGGTGAPMTWRLLWCQRPLGHRIVFKVNIKKFGNGICSAHNCLINS